jgi:uncharacterized membrane protein
MIGHACRRRTNFVEVRQLPRAVAAAGRSARIAPGEDSGVGRMEQSETASRPRIAAIDVARGVALIGMALYHLSWDFAYFHLAPAEFPVVPPMRVFSHAVAAAFLMLAGVSLALAHRGAIHWRAFLRRVAVVGGAAALLTLATYLYAPQQTIFFGILHCIAVASLLAAPLLRLPVWIALAASAVAFAAPSLVASPAFDSPALVWLGLGTVAPQTLDWRPLTPWASPVFLGVALTRLNFVRLSASPLWRWRPVARAGRAFAFAGRHSLAIYLIHQPILFAILFAATEMTGFTAARQREEFTAVCQRECVAGGGELGFCATACACVTQGLQQAGLSRAIARDSLDDAQRHDYSRIVRACSAGQPTSEN